MLVRHILSLVIATAGLAACREGADQTNGGHTAPPAQASADKDTRSGQEGLYTMELSLPKLPPKADPLRHAIDRFVDGQKRAFLDSLDAPGAREQAREMPWDLNLDIAVSARTDRFINVQVDGQAFTGGAHPAPIVDSFTFDKDTDRVVGIRELFTDPDAAEHVFASEARRQLITQLDDQDEPLASDTRQIEEGTAPGKDHYRVFNLLTGPDDKVHGLTFIFPPYQVAAYAAGPQAVDVPSEVFFSYLKPEYREAFR
ncbi:DUF3298 and DUF4163 domain-containing protein [Luteibacter aegosomatissinici]|uniref:DUF3298 and DUF4163 domain-containing protein n=1 Tax=Luteibacter aegosomatissinici TaxID=2911539 RepID=UPI001FF70824|nr:DUF3298 and DUF4163 domain-containing protein [Luteibacter aegosomatissinici]UPG95268.1 DUF3298 and DUF4163 domain-containing protein [Luteibacter aegosomatissinici]